MTSEITVLDPEPQIPWQESFHLRCGVDALTGEPKYPALKTRKSTVQDKSSNRGSKRVDLWVETIHGVHQQSRRHMFQVQGTINAMVPLSLNGSFAIQGEHVSFNRSFLVETIVFGQYNYEKLDLEDLELTDEAQALIGRPGEFRKRYGDYFVLGSKLRYWFHALVECR
jgi:hypothetical protein